jgi:hypothetical protein
MLGSRIAFFGDAPSALDLSIGAYCCGALCVSLYRPSGYCFVTLLFSLAANAEYLFCGSNSEWILFSCDNLFQRLKFALATHVQFFFPRSDVLSGGLFAVFVACHKGYFAPVFRACQTVRHYH